MFEKPVDYCLKLDKRFRANQRASVDKKRWSAGHAELETIVQIFGHLLPIASGVQACGKGLLVKSDLFGKVGEVPSSAWCLAGKQAVMVFPKLSLISCALGGLCSSLRMRVVRTGIIPIHHLDLARVLPKNLFDHWQAELAVWTLKI